MKLHVQILIFLLLNLKAFCQDSTSTINIDSSGLKLIRISHTDSLRKYEEKPYISFLGTVVIEHDGITMTCDSAHFFSENNFIEAFENVNITKANGVNAHSNYIKYTGNNNTAFMKGDVQIIDGANTLSTEELTYNIKTKIGKYTKSGTLQNEGTTVTSDVGTYNGYSQQTYFQGNVVIVNTKYTIESKELTYNLKNKVVKFLDESTIITEDATIYTNSGTYDSKNENAVFTSRTTVQNEDQTIIGNTMTYNAKSGKAIAKGKVIVIDSKEATELYSNYAEYNKTTGYGKATGNVLIIDSKNDTRVTCDVSEFNKLTGFGKAIGNVRIENEGGKSILTSKETEYNKKSGYAKATGDVIFVDTVEHSKLLAGMVEYNEFSKFMLATMKPKLITLADEDSLYMRSDTMMSVRTKDASELKIVKVEAKSNNEKDKYVYNLLYVDSTYISENEQEPKLIIANKNVRLYSDSMQAVCDSLSYSQTDSTFRLFKNPILWSKNQQSNADTIYIKTINNKISELNMMNNSLLVSMTGYEGYYDQVSGGFIDAFFINNEIQKVYVNQNAESLYYAKDDDAKYIGTNKAESSSMNVYFEDKEVNKILMLENPKGAFYPIDKLNEAQKFLSTFKLLSDKKPKSKQEILED